ncbi:MAG: UvrD-helicase domain-containing protein [Gammaproteobacteria bacterium]
MMPQQVKVAISADFFSAFGRLPQAQQGKVARFLTNFQRNPTSPGINYERIQTARDPNMRSVRIDQAYRGIVLKPERGEVYMLLWVDKHDEAYAWAAKHQCDINAATGAIQVYEVEQGDWKPAAVPAHETVVPGAYAELTDDDLLLLGVPEPLLGLVRSVHSEFELDSIQHRLPVEVYEGLFLYMAGTRLADILAEREPPPAATVDVEDFSKALEKAETRSRFVVVEDEFELASMLNAPLEKWRVFLHPSQRRLVEGAKKGPVRVLGGAGTGKTVVAMHRAKWLAENLPTDAGKILFTTFTKNLATDIEQNVSAICSPAQMARLEVTNLDSWVVRFLRKRKYAYQLAFGEDTGAYWQRALDVKPSTPDLPDAFYREEWERVVQPQGIEKSEQFMRASRLGRGTRLNRAQRVAIWPVLEEYRNQLALAGRREISDAYGDAAALLQHEALPAPYAAVVVDEAQDMGPQAFRLLRAMVPEGANDLFIVGDGHQRIYGRNKVVLSQCGINIRGRSQKLRINYRTTEEIRRWAVGLLEGKPIDDLDGGRDSNDVYKSLTRGDPPQVRVFRDQGEQAEFLRQFLLSERDSGTALSHICVVARTNSELDGIEQNLVRADIPVSRINPKEPDRSRQDGVRLATMHRVKGLEFDTVILASVNERLVPLAHVLAAKGDAVEQQQADIEERALVYVAVTRAKRQALVLAYGKPSPYLSSTGTA